MNYSPAYIISEYLINEGLVTLPGDSGNWPVYVATLPDGDEVDDDAVSCLDTSSLKDGRIMNDGENIFHAGVQILIRSKANDYNLGYQKASAIASKLETVKRTEVIIDSVDVFRLDSVTDTTGIVVVGQEEENSKRRNFFSLNFLVTLKEI